MTESDYVSLINGDMKSQPTCYLQKFTRLKVIGICVVILFTIPFLITKSCVTRQVTQITLPNLPLPKATGIQKQRFPHCIIIGVKKAGTGALRHFLNLHPDIVTTESKEPNFFSFKYDNGFDWYRSRMPFTYEGQITIDKSSNNFQHIDAPERTYKFNNSIQLIIVVREPVERIISDFTQRTINNRSRKTFEKSVFYSRTRELNKDGMCVKPSLYYSNTKRWLRYFPRKQIHFVDGENLKRQPYDEIYKVETFLGVSHQIHSDRFVFNATKGFYCYKRTDMTVECLRENKGRKHMPVDPDVRERLKLCFKPLNNLFFKLVGRKFDWT